ncbi:hypothetical protein PJF56_05440 [Roseofilum sp. BLCC_M91]|uniref:Glycerophosphoryl diester phosphodiesterase membrane domain-containing protein n=1 Tax=Roseofilum halophilum BLCC-M91 TaxID=3022259 RepID=A0ABT7BGI9_9CYAN|nr:hypothetical protein [Roseofilum halophilum]MDJ1178299.1 hypothetical protein [Roseofilum halophilum BLCC-M91]
MESNLQSSLQQSLLGVPEYLSIGWSEFRKNIQIFCIFTLITNIPLLILEEFEQIPDGLEVLLSIISSVLVIIVGLALPNVVERSIRGQSVETMTVLQNAAPKFFIAFGVSLLVSIAVALGLVVFIIPGIWLAIRYSFAYYAVALRDCGFNAMSYSQTLVKGRWWGVFGRLLLLAILLIIPILLLASIIGIVSGLLSVIGLEIAAAAFLHLATGIITYYFTTVSVIMFLNFDYTANQPADSVGV